MSRTIIRASEQNRGVQQVAFNFDDMATQANRYLEQVKAEATQILVKAKQEAEQIKQQAVVAGQAAGQKAVADLVQRQLGQQLATLLPALHQVIGRIQDAKQSWLTHWEKSAVHLATAIAARIVRREIVQQPQISVQLIREALELSAGAAQLKLHLSPADHQALTPQIATLTKEMHALGTVEVMADPAVTPGGCRLETQFGTIDQQIETQLARIEEELT